MKVVYLFLCFIYKLVRSLLNQSKRAKIKNFFCLQRVKIYAWENMFFAVKLI